MTWQLRRAGLDDLDAVTALETRIFGTDAWSRDGIRGELVNPQGYYVVAFRPEHPESIEGYAGLLAPPRSQQADVQTIAVAETARRRGLGRLLMLTLIHEARERGAEQVFLEVRADNPDAQRLYDSLGFERIAVRPRYYQPDGVDAIVMQLTVETPTAALA